MRTSPPYPLTKNQVVLRLRYGYSWREAPGPLRVIGVDTGGGPVKVGGDEGVEVADVHDNHDLNDFVVVTPTADTQLVYHDQADIVIKGQGFNPVGNVLRWANGQLGWNLNYTTVSTSEDTIRLRLVPGSAWRQDTANLPRALTLLAIDAGAGFVAVGPINSAKGRDVAMVFERPEVHSDQKKIFRTHSHEFHVMGTGFPELMTGYRPQLRFSPPLMESVDYTLRVVDRTDLKLTLLDGRAWRESPGGLTVTHINTRGDAGGWIDLPGEGVHVAEVAEDIDASVTGGVEVFPMGVKVYQSALLQKIDITGSGLKAGMKFTLYPPMVQFVDYEMEVVSQWRVVLHLRSGHKWRWDPGYLIARAVMVDGKEYQLDGSEGVCIAIVLADPVITTSTETLHETQSKILAISGTGFTNIADVRIRLVPTPIGSYTIINVSENVIRVQLQPEKTWLPVFITLKDGDDNKKAPLQVASIDTGAGMIDVDSPVTVGYIIKDREDVVCDDSCEFAFDGVCDDGSDSDDDGAMTDCVRGTDCTDCGGLTPLAGDRLCTNDCVYARDGVCDDPRGFGYCALGTGCADCGPSYTGNSSYARVPTAAPAGQPNRVQSVVQSTSAKQRVYHDQEVLYLSGTLLHPVASALRWSNQMRGDGADYWLTLVDHSTLALRRADSFVWERAFLHLPTVLYLEAVNDGVGKEVQFRTLPGRGVDVATVFERPVVRPSESKLYRTAARSLHIQGRGFTLPQSGYPLMLPLKEGRDYRLRVVSRTDLFIDLSEGTAWSQERGPLYVTAINTAGGEDGWVWFPDFGVQVAEVVADPGRSGWVTVTQALLLGGAALVGLALGGALWYTRSVSGGGGGGSGLAAARSVREEMRYQKVAGSEGECEMATLPPGGGAGGGSWLGGSSAGAGGLVLASLVVVGADADEEEGGADVKAAVGDRIQEAAYPSASAPLDPEEGAGAGYVAPSSPGTETGEGPEGTAVTAAVSEGVP